MPDRRAPECHSCGRSAKTCLWRRDSLLAPGLSWRSCVGWRHARPGERHSSNHRSQAGARRTDGIPGVLGRDRHLRRRHRTGRWSGCRFTAASAAHRDASRPGRLATEGRVTLETWWATKESGGRLLATATQFAASVQSRPATRRGRTIHRPSGRLIKNCWPRLCSGRGESYVCAGLSAQAVPI